MPSTGRREASFVFVGATRPAHVRKAGTPENRLATVMQRLGVEPETIFAADFELSGTVRPVDSFTGVCEKAHPIADIATSSFRNACARR